jgi:hypothetical protein
MVLSVGLFLDVVLGAALQGLAGVVLLLIFCLGSRVARQASGGVADGASDTVRDARAEIVELALGLLLLALEVLLTTGLLEGLQSRKRLD